MAALLALTSSLLWGTSDFVGGSLSRRVHPLAVVGVSQLTGLVALLLVGIPLGAFAAAPTAAAYGALAGVVGVLALGSFYTALAHGTMGVVAPVAATGVVVPVMAGLVAGERPAAIQMLGIVVAVVGVVLASGPELRAVEDSSVRGGPATLGLAGVSAVGFGIVLLLLARGSQVSVGTTLLAQRGTGTALLLVLMLATGRPAGLTAPVLRAATFVGLAEVAANALYGIASRSGLLSLVAVLGSLYPVVTALLARFVHGERLARVQVLGVAVALTGVAMIGAGGL